MTGPLPGDAAVIFAAAQEEDWSGWDVRPDGRLWDYRPESVAPAFEALARADTPEGASDAYNALMDALGHNHSGTPYPAMVPGTVLLARLVPELTGWPLTTALEVLTDCFLWTRDEPDFIAGGHTYNLTTDVAAAVLALVPELRRIRDRSADPAPTKAAAGLLEALDVPEPA